MLGFDFKTVSLATGSRKSQWQPTNLPNLSAWYDPSDLSTLFQDAAGTIAVASDGDPVGRILDKSGNGYHLSQTNTASKPSYHTDGVRHWIESDGVDDFMQANTRFGLAANPALSVVAALRPLSYDVVDRVLHIGGVAETGTLSASVGTAGASWRHNNGYAGFGAAAVNLDHTFSWWRGASSTYAEERGAVDGVPWTFASGGGTNVPTSTTNNASIFAQSSTSDLAHLRLYGLVLLGVDSSNEREQVESFLSSKY